MNVTLSAHLIDEMIAHARSVHPLEACGLLVGHGNTATRFIAIKNVLGSETAYEVDPAALASTFRSLREQGEELVAIFHSHPRGPAQPSARDLKQASYPEAAHLIASLAVAETPEIRGFRIIDGQGYEIELHAIV
jgi:proteasome lid subunit RPN8/RPN11